MSNLEGFSYSTVLLDKHVIMNATFMALQFVQPVSLFMFVKFRVTGQDLNPRCYCSKATA